MEDLPYFEGALIVGERLAAACDKKWRIMRCVESVSFRGYVGIRRQYERRRTAGKNQKTENTDDCTLRRTVSKNHRTTAAMVTAEPNILESRRPCFLTNSPT
jgi:hypothetical protein